MLLDCTVRILGTPWRICIGQNDIDKRLCDCDGFTDKTSKLMMIDDCRHKSNFDEPMLYIRKVVRHEIIHAFMLESGLDECLMHEEMGEEEQMVDWFAYQYPKIRDVIETVDEMITEALQHGNDNLSA